MDLRALRDSLGLPQQFTRLEEVDLAAKFRVARREASAESRVDDQIRQLDQAYAASVELVRTGRWRSWFLDSAYHRLQDAVRECDRQSIRIQELEGELGASQPRPYTRATQQRHSRGIQPATRLRLREHSRGDHREARLRAKLAKWALPIFPRLRSRRALAVDPSTPAGPARGNGCSARHVV